VVLTQLGCISALADALERVLADRFEHAEPRLVPDRRFGTKQAVIEQRC
jgi:hypothetical protein